MAVLNYYLLFLLVVPYEVQSWFDRMSLQTSRVGEVTKCEFPSAVFIRFTDNKLNHKECGGIILDAKRVATAAHCVIPDLHNVELKTRIVESSQRGMTLSWRRVVSKATNKRGERKNGLAIITLQQAIRFYSCHKPIVLAKPNEEFYDSTCTAIGWVLDQKQNKKFLTKTQQSIVPSNQCSSQGLPNVEQGQLCVAGLDIGFEHICLGDAGVPLICMKPDGRQVLVGFATTGNVCSDKHSIFTDVTSHNTWLSTRH